MRAAANFFDFISRTDGEFNAAPMNGGHNSLRLNTLPGRRCGKMLDIDFGSNRTFARIEVGTDGIESRIFHRQHHHRRSKHIWQNGVLELAREVPVLDLHRENSARSEGYGTHEKPFADETTPRMQAYSKDGCSARHFPVARSAPQAQEAAVNAAPHAGPAKRATSNA